MKNTNLISICPVCHSKNIIQDIKYLFGDMIVGNGSHCDDCGVQFCFNSIYLKRELKKLATAVKRAKRELKLETQQ